MSPYRHRQLGTGLLVAMGVGTILTLIILLFTPPQPDTFLVWIVLVILLACLSQFWSLSVELTDTHVWVWFGQGLIRRSFRLYEIRGVRQVRNPWYYGWGIRLIPCGWMFNLSGFDAVELDLENNRKFRIGTNDGPRLEAAIQSGLNHADGLSPEKAE